MSVLHVLVLDAIAFRGGSKVATETILALLDVDHVRVSVLTRDLDSWQADSLQRYPLRQPLFLSCRVVGFMYFVRHVVLLLNIVWFVIRHGKVDVWLGASGPGVDMGIYLARWLLGGRVVQLIHGSVACSRTIGRCLISADKVFYLRSAYDSLQRALVMVNATEADFDIGKFEVMLNGLSAQAWPTVSECDDLTILWAASALKWKGLDLFIEALAKFSDQCRPHSQICFLRPKDIMLPWSEVNIPIKHVQWYESPENLNEIRAHSSVFISTSLNEPFGLSILEALAAGLCVMIPRDGAYWDQVLEDGQSCVKYVPGCSEDLVKKISALSCMPSKIKEIACRGRVVAERYRAESCYHNVLEGLTFS